MRQSRGARLGLVALAVVAGVVACGGDDDSASNTTSTSTTASSNTKDTGADQSAERERAALPAGGPVDEVVPPGDPAYEELAAGQCDELRRQVETWEAQGVAEAEGSNAIELYRSAANACLHDWDAAIAAFDRLTSDFGGDCARRAVLAWLRPLIEARRADASFDRDFVPAGGGVANPCPPETDSDTSTTDTTATDDTSTTDTTTDATATDDTSTTDTTIP